MSAIEQHDVFLFDLDGTLAADGEAPSPECVTALGSLLRQGKHVAIVTGRSMEEMHEVTSYFGSMVRSERLGSLVRFFTSSASVVYRPSLEDRGGLEILEWRFTEAEREAMRAIGEQLRRLNGTTVIDRGAQQTVFGEAKTMALVRLALKPYREQIRSIGVSTRCLHVLPKTAGKHHALEYYRRTIGAHTSIAIGDGFYEIPELEIRGNDVDFIGGATTCIHVGHLKPRDARVLFLRLGADGPTSTVRVLERMRAVSTRELGAYRLPKRTTISNLEDALTRAGVRGNAGSFFSKVVEYLLTTLEPEEVDRRARTASEMVRNREALADVAMLLTRQSPLDQGFGRWAGFEGDIEWVLRWLWDENAVRPNVPIGEHFKDRVRAPILPEELMLSLVRALPYVNRGDRVVLVGKDAECALPLLIRLVENCQANGVLAAETLEPTGIKISARKAPAGTTTVDSTEHLEPGNVGRQLRSMLRPSERDGPATIEVRKRALAAIRSLPADERQALHDAFGGRFEESLADLDLGELVTRIGNLRVHEGFSNFVAFCRVVVYALQSRLAELPNESSPTTVQALLADHQPCLGAPAERVVSQYRSITGRDTIQGESDRYALNQVLFRALGDKYASLQGFEFPFTPLLSALMSETHVRTLLHPSALFVDASFNGGTTVLFLRALRRIVATDATFRFAAIGGLVLHEPLRSDLEWHGHPYLPVLLEEGAPHTFDFFYDDRDERVAYASIAERLAVETGSSEQRREHIESIRSEHSDLFEGYADLAISGLDFGDLVRWWLRRDRVWEMRVLSDRLRFRWPHWLTVRNQQRAIALLDDLDRSVDRETRARLVREDHALCIRETRDLLESWLSRRQEWIDRACEFGERITDDANLLRQYVSAPSAAGWRRLQRVLMTTHHPKSPFV